MFSASVVVWATVHQWSAKKLILRDIQVYLMPGHLGTFWSFYFFPARKKSFFRYLRQNLLLDGKSQTLKLCDFGTAKRMMFGEQPGVPSNPRGPAIPKATEATDRAIDRGSDLTWSHGTIEHQNWFLAFLGGEEGGRRVPSSWVAVGRKV